MSEDWNSYAREAQLLKEELDQALLLLKPFKPPDISLCLEAFALRLNIISSMVRGIAKKYE